MHFPNVPRKYYQRHNAKASSPIRGRINKRNRRSAIDSRDFHEWPFFSRNFFHCMNMIITFCHTCSPCSYATLHFASCKATILPFSTVPTNSVSYPVEESTCVFNVTFFLCHEESNECELTIVHAF